MSSRRYCSRSSDRISGRPSLVLELHAGDSLAIASVSQPGVVGELAERIAVLRIADAVYAWSRPDIDVDRSLLPPGLRNGNGA